MQVEQLLGFGPYRFDLGVEQVWRGKLAVKLTPKALVVLRTLVTGGRIGHQGGVAAGGMAPNCSE